MNEHRFPVVLNSKWGAIDQAGNLKIPTTYESISDFSEGLASFQRNGLWGVLSSDGEEITRARYSEIQPFSNQYAVFEERELFGYLSASGKIAIKAQFSNANAFCEGLAAVQIADSNGECYIEKKGRRAFPADYFHAGDFSEGLADVLIDSKGIKAGYIDKDGTMVIKPSFELAYRFSEGLAVVGVNRRKGTLHGVIDKNGDWVQEPWFSTADAQFCEGLCPIWDDAYGFIDVTGKKRIPCRFYNVGRFTNGLCPASIKIRGKVKEGFIDKNGDWAIAPDFDFVEAFEGPLAAVTLGDELGYIDRNGNFVWDPSE